MAVHHPSSRCRERSRCLRLIVEIDRRVGMPDQIPRRAVPARWDSRVRRELPQRARDEPSRSIGGSGGAGCPVKLVAKVRQRPGRQPYAGPCLRCWSWGVRGRWVTAGGNAKLAATDPTLTGCGTRR